MAADRAVSGSPKGADMTEDERKAMEWLDLAISELADGSSFLTQAYAHEGDERPFLATLKAMLARLPTPTVAARKEAKEIINRLCADPAMWATHGMPGDVKLQRLEDEFTAVLGRPALPDTLTDEMVEAIWGACVGTSHRKVAEQIVAALRSELTKPATKTVEVWRVEWAERSHARAVWWPYSKTVWNEGDANNELNSLARNPLVSCIRITGPHKQEVPA